MKKNYALNVILILSLTRMARYEEMRDVNKSQTPHFYDKMICNLPGLPNTSQISNFKLGSDAIILFILFSFRTSRCVCVKTGNTIKEKRGKDRNFPILRWDTSTIMNVYQTNIWRTVYQNNIRLMGMMGIRIQDSENFA